MTKQELEEEKIKLEIEDLKKPWYKKASYLGVLLPSTIAFLSILSIYYTGLFDAKRELLKIERDSLQRDITRFTLQKAKVRLQLDSLEQLLENKSTVIDTLIRDRDSLISRNNKLELQVSQIKFSDIAAKVDILPKNFDQLILKYENEQKFKWKLHREGSINEDLVVTFTLTQKTPLSIYYPEDSLFSKLRAPLENYFEKFNFNKDSVGVIIIGNADLLPIAPHLKYNGEFGQINEQYYSLDDNQMKMIDLRSNEKILDNEQLAFLRAYSAKRELFKSRFLNPSNIKIQTKIYDYVGAEYRNSQIIITVKGGMRSLK